MYLVDRLTDGGPYIDLAVAACCGSIIVDEAQEQRVELLTNYTSQQPMRGARPWLARPSALGQAHAEPGSELPSKTVCLIDPILTVRK
jgi:hypothetical protein